jgi:hypothetical protein
LITSIASSGVRELLYASSAAWNAASHGVKLRLAFSAVAIPAFKTTPGPVRTTSSGLIVPSGPAGKSLVNDSKKLAVVRKRRADMTIPKNDVELALVSLRTAAKAVRAAIAVLLRNGGGKT